MMKFFKKIKKPIVGFIFVLLMFFGFGDFDTLKTSSQLTIKKASAASINICTGNYSVPSKKITPHGAILKNGSVFNWINATQYDTYFNVITCNSYNDDKNLESWRVDNYTDWFQYDCNGSWLGGVSWKKQQWIFPAYTPSHTVSCLNIPSASCSSTSGCTLVSHTLPAFGSCSGNNYPSALKLISNTTGGDIRVRIQQFSVNSVMPGDVFTLTVYSHSVSVTATSSDTTSTIASKLIHAINATTASQWNEYGSFPSTHIAYTDTDSWIHYPTKPYAYWGGPDTVIIRLDYQHSFAPSVKRACSNFQTSSLCTANSGCSWSTPTPTVTVWANGSTSPATVPSGSNVSVTWDSTNATNCTCTYLKNGVSTSCGTGADKLTTPYIAQGVNAKTTFTVSCTQD